MVGLIGLPGNMSILFPKAFITRRVDFPWIFTDFFSPICIVYVLIATPVVTVLRGYQLYLLLIVYL